MAGDGKGKEASDGPMPGEGYAVEISGMHDNSPYTSRGGYRLIG